MKKITAIIVASLMIVALSACSNEDNNTDNTQASTTTAVETTAVDTTTAEETESPVSDIPAETETPVDDTTQITRGTHSSIVYNNDFIGLHFDIPDGWTCYTDEQLADLVGLTADDINGNLEDAFGKNSVIYDFKASDSNDVSSVSVSYEKVDKDFDLETYVKETEESMTDMGDIIAGTGGTNLGIRYFSTIDHGNIVSQKSYYAVEGDCLITITASTDGSDYTIDYIESCFG